MEEINNAPIEPQKKQSTAYWMGQVDTTLTDLRNLFGKSVEENADNWKDERAWRITISTAINGLDKRLSIVEHNTKKPNGIDEKKSKESVTSDDQLEKKAITWKWITDKLAAPVIVAVVIFLLINLFPQIIAHLANP